MEKTPKQLILKLVPATRRGARVAESGSLENRIPVPSTAPHSTPKHGDLLVRPGVETEESVFSMDGYTLFLAVGAAEKRQKD